MSCWQQRLCVAKPKILTFGLFTEIFADLKNLAQVISMTSYTTLLHSLCFCGTGIPVPALWPLH